MKILSISTATNHLSVALNEGQKIIVEKNESDQRNHSEHLDPMIVRVLQENKLQLNDIDRFAVAIGPGSYTGLRIGITTVKMFASILNKDLVGISTLQALAKSANTNDLIISALDARNDNYFAGGYLMNQKKMLQNVIPDGHYHIDILLAAIKSYITKNKNTHIIFLGSGLKKQDKKIKELSLKYEYGTENQNVLHAGLIGQLAEKEKAVNPNMLLPRYLRRTQAEIDWHKKTGKPFGSDNDYVEEV